MSTLLDPGLSDREKWDFMSARVTGPYKRFPDGYFVCKFHDPRYQDLGPLDYFACDDDSEEHGRIIHAICKERIERGESYEETDYAPPAPQPEGVTIESQQETIAALLARIEALEAKSGG